jgi:5-methylcytosine-specific restriction endonuclease McrA
MSKHPLCQITGCNSPTEQVHHKIPVAKDPSKVFVESNLLCLCKKHHEQIESAIIRGVDITSLIDTGEER